MAHSLVLPLLQTGRFSTLPLAIAICFFLLAEPEAAMAGETADSVPYSSWDGRNHRPPAPVAAQPTPLPLPPRPARPRRTVEIVPELAAILPRCDEAMAADDRCAALRVGGSLGAIGLWRPYPFVAFGLWLAAAALDGGSNRHASFRRLHGEAAWALFTSRVYFLEEGSSEPYIELGVGEARFQTTAREQDGRQAKEAGVGFSLAMGAGYDFYVGKQLRLGPHLSYLHGFMKTVQRCPSASGVDCEGVAPSAHGSLHATVSLGARLTILLGAEH